MIASMAASVPNSDSLVSKGEETPFLLQFAEKIPGTVFPSSHSDDPTYMGATQTGGHDRADYETD